MGHRVKGEAIGSPSGTPGKATDSVVALFPGQQGVGLTGSAPSSILDKVVSVSAVGRGRGHYFSLDKRQFSFEFGEGT